MIQSHRFLHGGCGFHPLGGRGIRSSNHQVLTTVLWAREGVDLRLQIAMCDPFFMHHCQSVEQLLDYHSCITFIPPITIRKGVRQIPYGNILHRNVQVVIVLIGSDEFDEPLGLSIR